MTSAIPDVGLFAAKLREQAGASRRMMVRAVGATKASATEYRIDGYVMLSPDEALELASILDAALAAAAQIKDEEDE